MEQDQFGVVAREQEEEVVEEEEWVECKGHELVQVPVGNVFAQVVEPGFPI